MFNANFGILGVKIQRQMTVESIAYPETVLIKPLLQDNLRHILSTLGLIPDKS